VASRQAGTKAKFTPEPPSPAPAPHLPPPAVPHGRPSPTAQAVSTRQAQSPAGSGFLVYPLLQSVLTAREAAPGSGLGQRVKRLRAGPGAHAAARALPGATALAHVSA